MLARKDAFEKQNLILIEAFCEELNVYIGENESLKIIFEYEWQNQRFLAWRDNQEVMCDSHGND